jgi:type IV pilus assembly protein PilP
MLHRISSFAWLTAFCLLTLVGCGDDVIPGLSSGSAPRPGKPAPNAANQKGRGPAAPAAVPSDLPPLPVRDIQEKDFIESDTSRDPFRSYADTFANQNARRTVIQREVLMGRYSLDDIKVNGIITGALGRALVTDPSGLGWVIRVGDFVGKADSVKVGGAGGKEVAVNWRVDRIRNNDIVFIREDPSRPDIPPATRVLSLRTEDELTPEIRTIRRDAELPDLPNSPKLKDKDDDDKQGG